jgi:hypothetical protein
MGPRKKAGLRPKELLPLPVHGLTSGCEEETALLLPEKFPYRQGIWMEDGWQVFNHLENRSVLFICAKCREKGEQSAELAQQTVKVNLRG